MRPPSPLVLPLLLLLVAPACTDRSLGEDAETGGEVERPPAGELYGECRDADDCSMTGRCLRPRGEAGFCTFDCVDAGDCTDLGGSATPVCLPVDTTDASVCALDCADARCPQGMRCERVDTINGAKSLCF